jgi:hypothetical protein
MPKTVSLCGTLLLAAFLVTACERGPTPPRADMPSGATTAPAPPPPASAASQ